MTVSMMNMFCAYPWMDILGSNLSGDSNLKLRNSSGAYVSFVIAHNSVNWIRIINFTPAFTNDNYTLEYNGRDLFTIFLQCPVQALSGVYFIDSARVAMRDTYNQLIKKIPDPTIRTAYIGE